MSHTPGPWSCDYGVLSVFCDTGAEVAACVRGNHDDGSPLTCDEMECNLNLLAAAPELLAALREAYAALDFAQAQVDSEADRMHLTRCRRKIKPVIDRAEGRADEATPD